MCIPLPDRHFSPLLAGMDACLPQKDPFLRHLGLFVLFNCGIFPILGTIRHRTLETPYFSQSDPVILKLLCLFFFPRANGGKIFLFKETKILFIFLNETLNATLRSEDQFFHFFIFLPEKAHEVMDEKPATVKEGCVNLMGNTVLL